MSEGDGMDSSTQVRTARRVWALVAHLVMPSIKCRHFPGPQCQQSLHDVESPLERSDWMLEPISGLGERWKGLTGGEILPAHDYHNEGKRWCGLLSGLVL
jgi:hypothetical protein